MEFHIEKNSFFVTKPDGNVKLLPDKGFFEKNVVEIESFARKWKINRKNESEDFESDQFWK